MMQNVNMSFKICVNMLQLTPNVNIPLEICVYVFQLIKNVNITLEICVKKMDSKYQSVTIFISLDSKYQSFIDLYLDSKFRFPRHNCNKFNRIKFLILNFFFLTHLHNYSHTLSFKLV